MSSTYQTRKENGLCVRCGKPVEGNKAKCSECSEKDKERKKRIRKERIDNGLCLDCGKPTDRYGYRCAECAEKRNEYNRNYKRNNKSRLKKLENVRINGKESYHMMKSLGLCKCGKALAIGFASCPDCLEKDRLFQERKRNKDREAYNKKQNEYHRSKYKERKENGLCVVCGRPRGNSPSLECVECRVKRIKRAKKSYIPRSERVGSDLCYHCGKPVIDGMKVCAECYERDMAHLRIAWASPLTKKAREEYSNRFYKLMMADKERKKHEDR